MRKAEVEAQQLQRLEQVISDIAARLVRVRADGVDAEIDNAPAQIGRSAELDREATRAKRRRGPRMVRVKTRERFGRMKCAPQG